MVSYGWSLGHRPEALKGAEDHARVRCLNVEVSDPLHGPHFPLGVAKGLQRRPRLPAVRIVMVRPWSARGASGNPTGLEPADAPRWDILVGQLERCWIGVMALRMRAIEVLVTRGNTARRYGDLFFLCP